MHESTDFSDRSRIVSLDVNITDIETVASKILDWTTNSNEGRSVCVANVHMCMEAFDNREFACVVNNSDLVVADGRPLVWAQRLLGHKKADQVRGEDLTLRICRLSEDRGLRIGLYGGSKPVLRKLVGSLAERFPRLSIAYAKSPPFRPLTHQETEKVYEEISSNDVDVLFVGLGCPKQELWMAESRHHVTAVMLGVGAAFDFIAGEKKAAPRWVQVAGLEWLLRLLSEPRRLWRRYTMHNPRFIWHFAKQSMLTKRSASDRRD